MSRYPVISTDPTIQTMYLQTRKNLSADARRRGVEPDDIADHRFAEMLALRSPPGSKTDREFLAGFGTLEQQFGADKVGLNAVIRGAKKHGYNPGVRDVYLEPLASFPGDPQAFVSESTGGRGHVKRVCEQRGLDCRGAVNVNGYRAERDDPIKKPKARLAEDVIRAEERKLARSERGGKKKTDRAELRERVIEKHSPKF